MLYTQDPTDPNSYPRINYTNQHIQKILTFLRGGKPWNISKHQVVGSSESTHGVCRILKRAPRVTAKQIGVMVGNKKQYYLHQVLWIVAYGHLPLNEYDGALPQSQDPETRIKQNASRSQSTLVLAHICGRWNCFVTDHISVVPHSCNLFHCRCHDDIRVQNRLQCFSSSNEASTEGRDCWDRHPGPRCFYSHGVRDMARSDQRFVTQLLQDYAHANEGDGIEDKSSSIPAKKKRKSKKRKRTQAESEHVVRRSRRKRRCNRK